MKPSDYEEFRFRIQSAKDFGTAEVLEGLVYELNHFYAYNDSDVDVLLELIGTEA